MGFRPSDPPSTPRPGGTAFPAAMIGIAGIICLGAGGYGCWAAGGQSALLCGALMMIGLPFVVIAGALLVTPV